MKQIDIINAYKQMDELASIQFSKEDQWKIYCLRKALRPHVEFQDEQDKKLAEKYTPYADENGNLTGEKFLEFMREKQELALLEQETPEKIELPLLEGINFKTIEALENLIEFKN